MQHLLGLGHRRIAAVTGPAGWAATDDRRRGYHAALAGAGIMPDLALEVEGGFEARGAGLDPGTLHSPPEIRPPAKSMKTFGGVHFGRVTAPSARSGLTVIVGGVNARLGRR
jgi:LacI family transcriptional regulator